jgi:hypothetical protein
MTGKDNQSYREKTLKARKKNVNDWKGKPTLWDRTSSNRKKCFNDRNGQPKIIGRKR